MSTIVVGRSLALKDALTTISRDHVLDTCAIVSTVWKLIARKWREHDRKHMIIAPGETDSVTQTLGLDQRCFLGPGLFSVCTAPANRAVQSATRELDSEAVVQAFLDATYRFGTADAVARGRGAFVHHMQ